MKNQYCSAKGAWQKYTLFLEEQTKIKTSNEEAWRAVHLSTDIHKIKVKCDQFKKASMIESEFVDCITMAEKKNDMSYVIKGKTFKHKSEKNKWRVEAVGERIVSVEGEKENIVVNFQ